MKQPFFSICIPTYNRPKDLQMAIAICLKQTFRDFEIIISDNASTDETMETVKFFKDKQSFSANKRIKYFRNPKNIGPERNYQKVFSYAQGKYIFSMGDDDFILFDDTLEKVKRILDKKEFGFVRLNLIEKKFIGQGLRKSIINTEKDIKIEKNAKPEAIIEFFNKVAAGHLAGLIIKNSPGISNKVNDCTVLPWIEAIYDMTKKHGAYFLASHYMIITWSQGTILQHYDVSENNHLMFEKFANYIFSIIPPKRLSDFKLRYYNGYIFLQPAIKLYSNNNNLIKFNKRLLELEPRLKKNLLFWLMVFLAFIMPKFVWEIVRVIQHKHKNTLTNLKNYDKIVERFNYLERTIL